MASTFTRLEPNSRGDFRAGQTGPLPGAAFGSNLENIFLCYKKCGIFSEILLGVNLEWGRSGHSFSPIRCLVPAFQKGTRRGGKTARAAPANRPCLGHAQEMSFCSVTSSPKPSWLDDMSSSRMDTNPTNCDRRPAGRCESSLSNPQLQ
ncbi:hypothetical protein TNCV_592361 [Trichonephila clavipes]|nr:hypothetical protein TNCV_592361 [Trichonephila clavipes]